MKNMDILITGVGGQGLITFGRVLSEVYKLKGIRVLMAETHGMSQRGGSVEVHIRIGNVYSSLVPEGAADVIVGLELIETVRNLRYASKNTLVVSNTKMIRPALPKIEMPDKKKLIDYIKSLGLKIYAVSAHELAVKAGNVLSVNMVMLGALVGTGILNKEVSLNDFEKIISTLHMKDINLRAFKYGYKAIEEIVRE